MSGRGRGRGPSEGDWICEEAECGNMNFARRTECHRCGAVKKLKKTKKMGVEIGSGLADKSNGLFSAEDWQCGKCGNVNWARRSTCNVCNGPKFAVEEERTGLGGGFNERGIVEYKEHVSDPEDEYDDFGRRKKKEIRGSGNQFPRGPDPGFPQEEEDDEEEEEDDDDGDLSKYDLWGSADADADENQEKSNNGKGDKGGKSRSRSGSRKKKSRRSSSSSSSRSRSRSKNKKKSGKSRKSRSSSSSSSSSRSRSRSKKGSSRRSRSGGKKKRSRSRSGGSKKKARRSRSSSSSSSSGSSRSRSRDRSRKKRK